MGLSQCKKDCAYVADRLLHNWKIENKNNLVNGYIENEYSNPELAEAYMGAIICRYWNGINKIYNESRQSGTKLEDCYDLYIREILYTLEKRVWLNPEHALYKDPNGPDKALNRAIATASKRFYQDSNYDCRKANFGVVNVDELLEREYTVPILTYHENGFNNIESPINNIVVRSFKKGNYFLAFMVDGIANYNVFKTRTSNGISYEEFNKQKLSKHIRSLDNIYACDFSNRYSLELPQVVDAINNNIKNLSDGRVRKYINKNLIALKDIVKEQFKC